MYKILKYSHLKEQRKWRIWEKRVHGCHFSVKSFSVREINDWNVCVFFCVKYVKNGVSTSWLYFSDRTMTYDKCLFFSPLLRFSFKRSVQIGLKCRFVLVWITVRLNPSVNWYKHTGTTWKMPIQFELMKRKSDRRVCLHWVFFHAVGFRLFNGFKNKRSQREKRKSEQKI